MDRTRLNLFLREFVIVEPSFEVREFLNALTAVKS